MRKFLAILIGATALSAPTMARNVQNDQDTMTVGASETAPPVQVADRGFGDRFREMRQERHQERSSAPPPQVQQPQAQPPARSNDGGGWSGGRGNWGGRSQQRESGSAPVYTPPVSTPTPRSAEGGERNWGGDRGWGRHRGGNEGSGNWGGRRGGERRDELTTRTPSTPRASGNPFDRDGDGRVDPYYDRNGNGRADERWDDNNNGRFDRKWDRNKDGQLDRRWDRDGNGELDRRWDRNGNGKLDRQYRNGGSWGGSHNGNWGNNNYGNWNSSWRNDRRYDWNDYRTRYGHYYRQPRYANPYGWNYGYNRFSIGIYLDSLFYSNRYWISDPYQYRLPPADGPYRWVRYYDDVLLVDLRNGRVVDVIHDFFW